MKINVIFNGESSALKIEQGETALKAIVNNGHFVDAPCGGAGKCGKCKITVRGHKSDLSEKEHEKLTSQEIDSGVRLACYFTPSEDCTIILSRKQEILTHTAFTDEAIKAKNSENGIGLAVDIGTTTVAAYFYEMQTGELIATRSGMNPQREYGADVISRIAAIDKEVMNMQKQKQLITDLINSFIIDVGVEITKISLAGNTTMQHIVSGLNPSDLARAPYTMQSSFGNTHSSDDIPLNTEGDIYLSPCISAYVGGDISAGIIGCDLDLISDKIILFTDIGTNGEMALSKNGKIFCCSTAAGPAFEGAQIKKGVGSIPGAINKVWLEDGNVKYSTINDIDATGICGSGIIDAVAVMLDCGAVEDTGYLNDEHELVEDDIFIIDKEKDMYISATDIREVQLAKSAIAAGIDCLVKYAEVEISDIDSVFLAGGFGAHISAGSACAIGLFNKDLVDKIKYVGNSSGYGASKILLNDDCKNRVEELTKQVEYIELSGDLYFNDRYIENMLFE